MTGYAWSTYWPPQLLLCGLTFFHPFEMHSLRAYLVSDVVLGIENLTENMTDKSPVHMSLRV